jgi:hypothetical protein
MTCSKTNQPLYYPKTKQHEKPNRDTERPEIQKADNPTS